MSLEASGSPAWGELIQLSATADQEKTFLESLLVAWSRSAGSSSAAVYLEEGGRYLLECSVGDGHARVLDATAAQDAGRRVPGGLITNGSREMADGAELALLSFGLKVVQLRRNLKRKRFEESFRDVEQQALYDVGLSISATLDLGDLSEAILSWALSLLDARCAALYLREDGEEEATFRLAEVLGGEAKPSLPVIDPSEIPEDLFEGASHTLAVGIKGGGGGTSEGLLAVADKESRHGVGPFGDSDRRTLNLFANQAGIALENARLHQEALAKKGLERELGLAAEIQRQILPREAPVVDGYELAGWNRPARHAGGDYYDFNPRPEGDLILSLGDVTGKGMPAALMVSTLHSALRLMTEGQELGPGILERLNRHIYESSAPNKFITLIVGELDRRDDRFLFINAGHNPGVILGLDGEVRELVSSGLPLGLMPAATYALDSVELRPGDLLCIYSDGITECADQEGNEVELEGLLDLLREHRDRPLDEIIRRIDDAISRFAVGLPQGDDQTLVLLRRAAPA